MSNIDWENHVHPSFASPGRYGSSTSDFLFNNLAMRMGVVTNIYYPDQDNKILHIQYDVAVFNRSRNVVTVSKYRKCSVSNLFGMSNNSLHYTLQPGDEDAKTGQIKNGSQVLILCLNGSPDAGQAIIVGGLNHPQMQSYTSEDGQFYDFNFNGIKYNINKDGELAIQFNSVIDSDGNKVNPDASGTTLKFDKDGGFSVIDNENQVIKIDRAAKTISIGNGAESIVVDKTNKSIAIHSSGDINQSSNQNTSISATQDLNISSQNMNSNIDSNVQSNIGGNINEQLGGSWNVQAGGSITITSSSNVIIQAPTAMIQGQTTLLGPAPSLPIALPSVSQTLTMLGPVPLPGIILTGSSTVLGSP